MNYYNILDVHHNATPDEIKKKYKKMALKYHPDRGGNPDDFRRLSQAYEILSDPNKRAEYDNTSPFTSRGLNDMGTSNIDPNVILEHLFNNKFQTNIFHTDLHSSRPFNFGGSIPNRSQMFQHSSSTTINGDIKIETITQIRNGTKTKTIIKTNMKTGEVIKNINHISG